MVFQQPVFPVLQGGTNKQKTQLGVINNATQCKVTVSDFNDPTLFMEVPYSDEYLNLLQVENYVQVREGEETLWIQNDKPINLSLIHI